MREGDDTGEQQVGGTACSGTPRAEASEGEVYDADQKQAKRVGDSVHGSPQEMLPMRWNKSQGTRTAAVGKCNALHTRTPNAKKSAAKAVPRCKLVVWMATTRMLGVVSGKTRRASSTELAVLEKGAT